MHRRTLLDALDDRWLALCVWFFRRAPRPPARAHRLLARLARALGLPVPCPVRVRRTG